MKVIDRIFLLLTLLLQVLLVTIVFTTIQRANDITRGITSSKGWRAETTDRLEALASRLERIEKSYALPAAASMSEEPAPTSMSDDGR